MSFGPFSIADQLDMPLLLVDKENCPIFLSTTGAGILQIKNREQLQEHQATLKPLLTLAAESKRRQITQSQGNLATPNNRIHEITLTATDGRAFPGIGFTREIQLDNSQKGSPAVSDAVIFYDVSHLEPVYKMINNSRLVRSYLIHCAAQYGANLGSIQGSSLNLGSELHASILKTLENSAAQTPVDLLSLITSVVEIVDPMLITTVSINTEVKTSALLSVDPVQVTKLLCHLLTEAADFVGAAGKIKLRAVLKILSSQRAKKKAQSETKFSEIVILAHRTSDTPRTLHPIESHLFRRSFPRQYRVTIGDSNSSNLVPSADLLNGIVPGEGQKNSFGNSTSLSEEAFSDNLRIASNIAKSAKLPFQVRRLRDDLLALYLPLPLSDITRVSFAKK